MTKSGLSNALELEIRREFSERLRNFIAQKKWIDDAIGGIVQHDPGLYAYRVRVKEISSVLKKIRGKMANEADNIHAGTLKPTDAIWSNATTFADFEKLVDDWVGCRIIAYLHDSLIPLHKEIISHKRLNVIRVTVHDSSENPRFSDLKLVESWDERRLNHNGYVGIHYILEPKPVDPCWTRDPKIFHKFELQIRTLLQEAWGQIQHAVIYKGRMPDYIKQERSDAFGGLAGFLSQCDIELARLAKDPKILNLGKSRPSSTRRQRPLNFRRK